RHVRFAARLVGASEGVEQRVVVHEPSAYGYAVARRRHQRIGYAHRRNTAHVNCESASAIDQQDALKRGSRNAQKWALTVLCGASANKLC
ncbi:hypothetical protein, partial [Bosea sp. TAB14]|uniref:hypothetical protein n=1 Tax=Bosea sp. TAB14 TaxID=3237481 RepID=UPI003F904B89